MPDGALMVNVPAASVLGITAKSVVLALNVIDAAEAVDTTRGVKPDEADNVVNAPAAAAVPPIAGGLAR